MSVQPDEDELQLRDRLRDLGVSYAPAPAATPRQELEAGRLEQAAPAAEEEAAVPAPRRSSPRLPDWWAPTRPSLADEEEPEPSASAPADDEPEDQEEPARPETPAPSSSPDRADYQTRMREWLESKREPSRPGDTGPDDGQEPEDDGDTGEEDDEDTEGDGPQPGGPVRKVASGLKRRARRPRRRPRFAAPGIPHTMKPERRSLVEIIRSTPDHVRWMTYNGSALAAGFWLGWPQWVKDGTAYVAAEHTLTDTYSFTCYALAAGVFFLDYRARGWLLPVAWVCRIPTVSLVVGVPLHGVDIPISQLY
ncbi:hypothetical protein [Streptomyces sp. NPDC006355]|uniref:hypothetical protein n=1 Tax=Streptomyces sp. NPDC006355 TaxID=3156758 RepID=UPI0033B6352F